MDDNLSFYEESHGKASVALFSIPLELGSDERGLARAPEYLLKSGLERVVSGIGRKVAAKTTIECSDETDTARAGRMKYAEEIAAVARASARAVEEALRRSETVVALGGDHSTAIGTIAGAAAARPNIGLIYIDAHPDCNTDETTITGNVHGMVAAALIGSGHPLLTAIGGRIKPENVLYIGLQDMDAAEIRFIRDHNLRAYTMLDIASDGLSDIFRAIGDLASRTEGVWVSMDMDSIDERFAPAVGMPNRDGLTRREALALAHQIGTRCEVAGLDIVEIAPHKDAGGKTARLALEILARFLGGEYSWYREEYMRTYRETNVTHAQRRPKKSRRISEERLRSSNE